MICLAGTATGCGDLRSKFVLGMKFKRLASAFDIVFAVAIAAGPGPTGCRLTLSSPGWPSAPDFPLSKPKNTGLGIYISSSGWSSAPRRVAPLRISATCRGAAGCPACCGAAGCPAAACCIGVGCLLYFVLQRVVLLHVDHCLDDLPIITQ